MYVYFNVDEGTLNRVIRGINSGKIEPYQKGKMPVLISLDGEKEFLHQGTVNFVDNQMNPNTGSISVRGTFDNRKSPSGVRILKPGMFVRVRLPIGRPHQAVLVVDRAVGSDQGLKSVYVLGAKNTVQYRRVETGALQEDGLRVITDGLKPDEWVVVGGLQQVRPRMSITPEQMPMPCYGQTDAEAAETVKPSKRPAAAGAQPRPAAGSKPKR
jgi:multidrug efflux system membrane fusion protein